MSRRRILFIAPIVPAEGGNGLSMRAGVFLEALSRRFAVTLLVVPVSARRGDAAIPTFVRERCEHAAVLPIAGREDPHFALIMRLKDRAERQRALEAYPTPLRCRYATPSLVRDASAAVSDRSFDAVHVMRLYLAPFADPFLRQRPPRPLVTIDLDDVESESHGRMARLSARLGRNDAARLEAAEARRFAEMERARLPGFDRVIVCSALDRTRLMGAHAGLRPAVIANAVSVPAAMPRPSASPRFDCLFVGALRYPPNADAAFHFCRAVLPELRRRMGREMRVAIVGSDPPPEIRALSDIGGVTLTGTVADVRPYYAESAIAVAPIRAGSGTRIKILEAFALGRPVVATSLGCEGLDAVAGEHLLVADAPETMAASCHRLLLDRGLAGRLAANAWRLARDRHAIDTVASSIGGVFAEALAGRVRCDPA